MSYAVYMKYAGSKHKNHILSSFVMKTVSYLCTELNQENDQVNLKFKKICTISNYYILPLYWFSEHHLYLRLLVYLIQKKQSIEIKKKTIVDSIYNG